jgi:hypothetical protein
MAAQGPAGMECHGAPPSWLYGPLLTKPVAIGIHTATRPAAVTVPLRQQ